MRRSPSSHAIGVRPAAGDSPDSCDGVDRRTEQGALEPATAATCENEYRAVCGLEQRAADLLARFQRPRRHHLVCALLLEDGREVFGLNIVSNIGVASVCAEQVAMGEAMKLLPQAEVSTVATLRATFTKPLSYEIVPPCGRCREILCEYAPSARVALRAGMSATCDLVPIDALLPLPFHRRAPERWLNSPATTKESGS
jgi:cytidine deaminase